MTRKIHVAMSSQAMQNLDDLSKEQYWASFATGVKTIGVNVKTINKLKVYDS